MQQKIWVFVFLTWELWMYIERERELLVLICHCVTCVVICRLCSWICSKLLCVLGMSEFPLSMCLSSGKKPLFSPFLLKVFELNRKWISTWVYPCPVCLMSSIVQLLGILTHLLWLSNVILGFIHYSTVLLNLNFIICPMPGGIHPFVSLS